MLWYCWRERKKTYLKGSLREPASVFHKSTNFLTEYKGSEIMYFGPRDSSSVALTVNGKWQPITGNKLKMNVDFAVKKGHDFYGIGIYRNRNGDIMAAFSKSAHGKISPIIGKCAAILRGIRFAIEHCICIESCCNAAAMVQDLTFMCYQA